jgi:uncharacterized repeat protein (TIGR03803 family)
MKFISAIILMLLAGLNAHAGYIFTNLFSFSGDTNGLNPLTGLEQGTDSNFYGTTSGGASAGRGRQGPPKPRGTVFKITSEGLFCTLISFNGTNGDSPQGSLVQANDGSLYGTTAHGGRYGYGTVFKTTTNGEFTTLGSFDGLMGTNGWWPMAGLIQGQDGCLYGTTYQGGTRNLGTVFRITTNGTLTTLVSFTGTNGSYPRGRLAQDKDGNLYGTTAYGGANKGQSPPEDSGYGTVCQLTTNGNFKTLFSFNGTNGRMLYAGVVQGSDGKFYGVTRWGGTFGKGTLFQVTADGSFASLFSFNGTNGSWPSAELVKGRDGNFYGTTETGGIGYNGTPAYGNGTIFQISSNGVFKSLFLFGGTNGVNPCSELKLSNDGAFYGTTTYGGAHGGGTVFRFNITSN